MLLGDGRVISLVSVYSPGVILSDFQVRDVLESPQSVLPAVLVLKADSGPCQIASLSSLMVHAWVLENAF